MKKNILLIVMILQTIYSVNVAVLEFIPRNTEAGNSVIASDFFEKRAGTCTFSNAESVGIKKNC